jgi:hypothetical protein
VSFHKETVHSVPNDEAMPRYVPLKYS